MLQIMKRQILVNIREKSNIFWTMLFPLILATLFHFTLGGTIGEHAMEDIRAAFVTDQNADSQEEEAFLKYLESFDQDWFQIIPMSQEEAREALKNDEILGNFYGGEEKKLVIGEDSTYTSILSQTLDIYEKNEHMLVQIAEEHPENLQAAAEAMGEWGTYTETVTFRGDSLDYTQNYFFALIAMTCLYGSFMGMYNTVGVQANTSDLGARLAAGCVKRYKTITASLLSSWLVSFAEVLVLLFYMAVVLGDIHIGEQGGEILLICFAATLYSSSIGMVIGTVGTWSTSLKNGIIVAESLACSFAADLMISGVKETIETYVPVINRINPGALITDAFYSVLIYEDGEKYFRSLSLLTFFGILLLAAAVLSMRRMRYESI